ncbi:hypothetical protein [Actinomadura hibisca]|uniref:hypothetical protein n=1 Tax=Actinomadura hibisca TaxID=68565 RepID=UPI000832C810|nr:hypothetical protein [Actinomadura hibisca]
MSFDGPRQARVSADQPVLTSERRTHLTVLDAAVVAHGGMSCGVVPRAGVPVLHVINAELPGLSIEAGCDFIDGAWWFTWAETGESIGVVADAADVAGVIARTVEARIGKGP